MAQEQADRSDQDKVIGFEVQDGIGIITLARPEVHNAQNPAFLDQLNEAWGAAAADPAVRVIVLWADGKHFSAGHDLSTTPEELDNTPWGAEGVGIEGGYRWELKRYYNYCRLWRDVPKPSIAAVQGGCIAAGLMLCWPCDLIVASDDAFFTDPVMRMAMPGVEYHAHTWEWGPRKAKEMLFTARRMDAAEAERIGAVNRVVPREELRPQTLELAQKIAAMNPFALAQAKRIVNNTLDISGQVAALQAAYENHWLGHSNALVTTANKMPVMADLDGMRSGNKGG